jgi:hypothetical protein
MARAVTAQPGMPSAQPAGPGDSNSLPPSALIGWATVQFRITPDAVHDCLQEGLEKELIRAWWIEGGELEAVPTADLPRLLFDRVRNGGWLRLTPAEAEAEAEAMTAWKAPEVRFSVRDFLARLGTIKRARPRGVGGRPPTHAWADGFADLAAVIAVNGLPETVRETAGLFKAILATIDCYPDDKEIKRHAGQFTKRYKADLGRT